MLLQIVQSSKGIRGDFLNDWNSGRIFTFVLRQNASSHFPSCISIIIRYGRAIEGARPEIRVITINAGVRRSENRTLVACGGVVKKFSECSTLSSIPGVVLAVLMFALRNVSAV